MLDRNFIAKYRAEEEENTKTFAVYVVVSKLDWKILREISKGSEGHFQCWEQKFGGEGARRIKIGKEPEIDRSMINK